MDHYHSNLELISDAESLGADSVWVSEHHQWEDGYLPQPLTFLSAVAARTSRVRLGTSIMIPALRSAIQVAEEAAIVDVISGGRVDLGLGVGWSVVEYGAFGADFEHRQQVTESRIRDIGRLLDEDVVTPPPVQRPFPIWAGYRGPKGARHAGRMGVGLLSLDRELFRSYREGFEDAGLDPAGARLAGNANIFVRRRPGQGTRASSPLLGLPTRYLRSLRSRGTDKPVPPTIDLDKLRHRTSGMLALQVLTPDEAIAAVRAKVQDLPVKAIYVFANIGGMPMDLAQRHVELWCTKVRPSSRWVRLKDAVHRGLIASHYSLTGSTPPAPAVIPFPERVSAAAGAGCSGIGLVGWDYQLLRESGRSDDDLFRVLGRHDLRVDEVELMRGWVDEKDELPETSSQRQALIYRMVEVFGPHHLIAGDSDLGPVPSDLADVAERFGTICDRVAPYGTRVGIEFIPGTRIPDAHTAWQVAQLAGRSNGGILVDILHHFRGGGTVEDLLEIPPSGFVGIQVSDHGPRQDITHFDEWRYGGLLPGEGIFELEHFFRVLDRHGVCVPYSIEILSPTLNQLGPAEDGSPNGVRNSCRSPTSSV